MMYFINYWKRQSILFEDFKGREKEKEKEKEECDI